MASGSIFLKSRTTGSGGEFYVDWTSTYNSSNSTHSVNLIFHIKNITSWGSELFSVYVNGVNAYATYPNTSPDSSYLQFCEYSISLKNDYYGKPTTSVRVSIPEIGYEGDISGQMQIATANPEYMLTINEDTGTLVTVNRTSSPLRGAATGTLSSGATLYVGDVLKITSGTVAGYSTTDISVSGATLSNGSCTVNDNITVDASASLQEYTLSLDAGSNTSITVKRTSSPLGGAAAGTLSSGSVIYYSDTLQISFAVSTGYDLTKRTVNGSTFASGGYHTVRGNVSVIATAAVKTFKLTFTQGAGTTITVNRTKSPMGGASIGNLVNGATIYYSDTLSVTVSTKEGYELLSQTVNGETFESGSVYTVTNNITVVTLTKTLGLVYIDDDSTLAAYFVYIDNGATWEQYIPYIDNGSNWDMCN